MQRAQTSRSGGQTEEQQSAQTSSRNRPEDDRVRIRVSGRQIASDRENAEEEESAHEEKKKGVKWAEGVVDNEHMCKKKSKKCCIFHKRREFGEWSDDDSDSEDECSCHRE